MIPNQRHLFSLPDDVVYLNCAYLSPQLKAVSEAGVGGLAGRDRPWLVEPSDFFAPGDAVRERFATLIGGDAAGVALIPAASYGLSVAAANVEIRPGQTIVVLAEQFPSNVYPWWQAASSRGARIRTVAREGGSWTDAILEAIDRTTAVVAIPQCHWTDGSIIDLEAIGRAARGCGAALVVDASQSVGAHVFDVQAIQPDYLVTVGYKWLLGPYRTACLWAAPHRRDGVPIEHGWMGKEGAEDFSNLVAYTEAFRTGAMRYDGGEFGDFMAMPMLVAALDQVQAWGVAEISETLGALTGKIEAGASSLGLVPAPGDERVPHMIGIRFPSGLPAALPGTLRERKVYVSVRGDSVRVAPHLYTTDGDVDRLLEVLGSFV
ncbi:MAG: aminotransferase class V-fold PLP-dependent enzyme [Acidimicrobiia bacterium]